MNINPKACNSGTSKFHQKFLCFFVSLIFLDKTFANPEGGQVAAGQASISATEPHTLEIHQKSDKAIINWQKFNIHAHEKTQFKQPSKSSITLNRVNPNNGASKINGSVKANGQIWIVNPAGIFFGPTAIIDVNGLVATTADINNDDFMTGNYRFVQSPAWNGSIINEGKISIAEKGLAALVAPGVENRGTIVAKLGTVVLGATHGFTLDFYGDGLIQFGNHSQVTSPAIDEHGRPLRNGVSNKGKIIADAGTVHIHAHVAEKIVDNAINMEGYTQAKSVMQKGGTIILSGGNEGIVRVAGKINVSGKQYGQHGGSLKVTGKKILIENSKIDVSGESGGGEILIGGDYQGKNPLIPNAEYTFINNNVKLNANALREGNGGKIIIWSDKATKFYGEISSQGGKLSGNGGFIETSGKEFLEARGIVKANAFNGQAGTWLLDPTNINITTSSDSRGSFNTNNTTNIFTPNGTGTANADVDTIIASLNAGTNVTIQTSSSANQQGNISLQTPIAVNVGGSGTATLTLNADNNINFNNSSNNTITANSGILNIFFNAAGTTTVTSAISTNGGYFNNVSNALTVNAPINTNGGNFNNTTSTFNLNSTVSTQGGSFSSTTQNGTTLGNASGSTPGVVNSGSGTIFFHVNADDNGSQNFLMNRDSALTSSNITSNAIQIFVNNTDSSSGTGSGSATLRGITTGNGGTLTVATNTGNDATGGDITYGGTGILDVGAGTITLSTAKIAGNGIATASNPLPIKAGTLNATTGSGGIFVTNTGTSPLTINTLHAERTDNGAAGQAQIISNTALQQGLNSIYVSTLTVKTLNDAGADITFNNANNAATTLNLQARNLSDTANANGTITYRDSDGFNITGLLTQANANLTAAGNVTDSGLPGIIVGGTLSLTAGSSNDITLNSTTNNFNKVTVNSAKNVTLSDVDAINLGLFNLENNLTVTAGGDVTQTNALISHSGTGILNVVTRHDWGSKITLNSSGNEFSTITLQTRNASNTANTLGIIQYQDASNIQLNAIRTASKASFTSEGDITDSGASTIGGALSLNAGSHDINLNNSTNDFHSIEIISGNNVILRDVNALILEASTISGLFSLTTGGSITQTGALNVSGITTLSAGSTHDITLNNPNNNFSHVIINSARDADIRDANSIILGTSNISNSLTINANDTVTQTGPIIVPTLNVKTLNDSGAAITLTNSENDIDTINLQARNATDMDWAKGAINFVNSHGFTVGTVGSLSTVNLIAISGIITGTATIQENNISSSEQDNTLFPENNFINPTIGNTTTSNISENSFSKTNVAMLFPKDKRLNLPLVKPLIIQWSQSSEQNNPAVTPTPATSDKIFLSETTHSGVETTIHHLPTKNFILAGQSVTKAKSEFIILFLATLLTAIFALIIPYSRLVYRRIKSTKIPSFNSNISGLGTNLCALLNNITYISEFIYKENTHKLSDSQKITLSCIISDASQLQNYFSQNIQLTNHLENGAIITSRLQFLLNIIVGFNQLIQEEKMGLLSHANRDYINQILISSKHISALIHRLISVSAESNASI